MELNKVEITSVTEVLENADRVAIVELADLQLAMVGGGIADVIAG